MSFTQRLSDQLFAAPHLILSVILFISVVFAVQIPGMRLASDFDELLPTRHPYIKLHEEVRDTFGGANVLTIALEVEDGTIFTNETLSQIQRLTELVDILPGVNHNLLTSVTYHTTRRLWVDKNGNVHQTRYYDPMAGDLSDAELEVLKQYVQSDPRVLGRLVSPDLRVAIISAHMSTGDSEVLQEVFEGVQRIRKEEDRAGIKIHATGTPMLTGWVYSYFGDIVQVLLYTLALVLILITFFFRRLYGILLPIIGIALSTTWGLGFLTAVGITLDPVSMPIVFLLAARATSHGVQIVERYYYELSRLTDGKQAARSTYDALIRPGGLAILTDAIGILAISMASAPYHLTLAIYSGFWALTIVFTVNLMIPLALSTLPAPSTTANKRDSTSRFVRETFAGVISKRNGFVVIGLAGAGLISAGVVIAHVGVQFGNTEPGSPLLLSGHEYNKSAARLSEAFPGMEELYVIARAEKNGALEAGLRDPMALRAIDGFERDMLQRESVQGSRTVSGLIKQVNRLFYDGDPRWAQIPDDPMVAGGILYAFMMSAPAPGALDQFIDPDFRIANLAFFLPDIQVRTLDNAILGAKYGMRHAETVPGLSIELAAGAAGVNAAINESNKRDTIVVTGFVLLAIFALVSFNYRSLHAGAIMLGSMIFAMGLSYAYMAIFDVGIHANIIPVVGIGIGMGIDYAIYVTDRVRNEVRLGLSVEDAIAHALSTTGIAVLFTAITLIAGVVMWGFSDLRFQAEAAVLLVVMILMFLIGALIVVPAWIVSLRPRFIVGDG